MRHVGVNHRSEEIRVQRWVTETFLEPVSVGIGSLGVDFGLLNFGFRWDVEPELVQESAIDESFEDQDENDRREGSNPIERPETKLEANREAHQGLHQDNPDQETVDDDVPQPAAALDPRDEHEHELVLVDP